MIDHWISVLRKVTPLEVTVIVQREKFCACIDIRSEQHVEKQFWNHRLLGLGGKICISEAIWQLLHHLPMNKDWNQKSEDLDCQFNTSKVT